jgi:hypothetical protein
MSPNDRRRGRSSPTSLPPEVGEIDVTWDEDLPPALRGSKRPRSEDPPDPDSEFDRVTAIPELPPEVFVKSMKGALRSAPPKPADSAPPELGREPPVMSVHPLDSAQFNVETIKPSPIRRVGSSAPKIAVSPQAAPTARPNSLRQRPARAPKIPSPTGLELDLSVESVKTSRPQAAVPAHGRDPRDPTIELDIKQSLAPKADPAVLEMKDRYAMGDFTGALVIAESIIETNPEDLEAPRYAQNCRDVLIQMYSARLGSLTQHVHVAVPGDQIRWLTLDHRAGFLLSLVDGNSSIEEILDISGMTRLDALRIMYQLLDQRVIGLR